MSPTTTSLPEFETSQNGRPPPGRTILPPMGGPRRGRRPTRGLPPTCSGCRRCTSGCFATSSGLSPSPATPMAWRMTAPAFGTSATRSWFGTSMCSTHSRDRGGSATSTTPRPQQSTLPFDARDCLFRSLSTGLHPSRRLALGSLRFPLCPTAGGRSSMSDSDGAHTLGCRCL